MAGFTLEKLAFLNRAEGDAIPPLPEGDEW
jgi:hypothetical protein